MVTNVTSLTGNGLRDWLIQRATALYFGIYALSVVGFLLMHPHLQYNQWLDLFHTTWFQLATIGALFAFVFHAWVGIWTVTTDYITCTVIRLSVQMLVILFLLAQLVWGLMLVWGR